MRSYTVYYNNIAGEEATRCSNRMADVSLFCINAVNEGYKVLRIEETLSDDKVNVVLNIFEPAQEEKTGITFEKFKEVTKEGRPVRIAGEKILRSFRGSLEIEKEKDAVFRFPSLIDMFSYLSPSGPMYSYHEFTYNENNGIFIDDDFVVLHSGDDNFFFMPIETEEKQIEMCIRDRDNHAQLQERTARRFT